MSTIADFYKESELALTAYGNFLVGIPDIQELMGNSVGMSATQADEFSRRWEVLAQFPDATNQANSGVSATLFQNRLTGEISLAIRGTEPTLTDIGADGLLAIGISSKLNPQFTALKAQIDTWLAPGGLLNGQTFSVTGHSLGGYLATAVKEQYPADVTQAYLYNAPGFGGVFGELLSGIGVVNAGNGNGISNLVGSEGISMISGLGVPAAPPVSILIEPAGGMGTGNHSIVTLTDSLAVYALYDRLAPGLDTTTLSGLLGANANDKNLTLENSLDALRELLTGITLDANTRTPTMVDATTRDQFYANLYDLQSNANYQAMTGQVSIVPLGGVKAAEMLAAAQNDGTSAIAYRYALVKGNAFAVVGNDTIYAQHNANGELNLYDAATGAGELTDTYLKERAAFVERKLYYGEHKIPYTYTTTIPVGTADPYIAENTLWQDRTDGIAIEHPGATANTRRVIFGSSASEADITGANANDVLFGGGGDDKLTGGKGNDWLEGGQGNDTYVYASGDGLDTILDTGGQNILAVDGTELAGGAQYGDARVHKDANGHLYVDAGQGNLIIDGNIVIRNYGSGGTFGLTMNGAAPDPAELTSLSGNAADNFIGMDVYSRDPNDARIDAATHANGQTFAGSSNILGSNAGVLEGGAGSDIIVGGAVGGSHLYADTRVDAATAIANGNTDAATGLKGDWLASGAGSDTLVGSTGNDVLAGGGGSDLLIGGAGDDDILGDSDYVATSFDWTVTDSNGLRGFFPVIELPALGGADVIYAGSGNDHAWGGLGNDIIFGEGGNDRLAGGAGNDTILGGANDDVLWGDDSTANSQAAGSDYLDGGDGNDVLIGGAGDDILIGGKDNDTIYTEGNDTIVYKQGDGDEIHLAHFDQNDVFNSSTIDRFEFEDGTVLTGQEVLARGFDLDGTAGDDTLIGTNTTDRINGYEGNDTLIGLGGSDRMRWRLIAANDEVSYAWRDAA